MNMLPPDSLPAARSPARAAPDLGARWLALHDAAGVVAALAGLPPPTIAPTVRQFPEAVCAAGGWRAAHARQGISDLCAILETGITALLAVHAAGTPATAPARALWDEFVAARNAMLELAPPGALGRRRLG